MGICFQLIIEADSSLWCWGRNDYKQANQVLTTTPAGLPTRVAINGGVTAIALGSQHTCFLAANGVPTCFGSNSSGQLGQGSVAPLTGQFTVLNQSNVVLDGVSEIDASAHHSCALKTNGTVWCWGGGDGSRANQVPIDQLAKKIAVGDTHSCAILADDTVACWGANELGQHGDGSHIPNTAPTKAKVCP